MATDEPEPSGAGIVTKTTERSVTDTVARFGRILAENGLKVFSVIDQRAEAAEAGLELRETVLVLFGNPRAGTPVMDAAPLSALDLPLKVLIWSDDPETRVSYLSPAAFADRYGLGEDAVAGLEGIHRLTDALVAADR
jgi:uncharacterized protein (DUF302 family)